MAFSGLCFISNKIHPKWDLQYLTTSRDESTLGANFVFCAFLFLHRLVSSPLSMLTGQLELSRTVEEFQTCHYLQDWVSALQFSGRSGIISQNSQKIFCVQNLNLRWKTDMKGSQRNLRVATEK